MTRRGGGLCRVIRVSSHARINLSLSSSPSPIPSRRRAAARLHVTLIRFHIKYHSPFPQLAALRLFAHSQHHDSLGLFAFKLLLPFRRAMGPGPALPQPGTSPAVGGSTVTTPAAAAHLSLHLGAKLGGTAGPEQAFLRPESQTWCREESVCRCKSSYSCVGPHGVPACAG